MTLTDRGTPISRLAEADLVALLRIRHFETALLNCFSQGILRGTTHTCLGQEYVPVAVDRMLLPDDFVFSNHRGHGHYLARFDDPTGLLAELTGRRGAICGGYGGSQHILRDRYMSTGVQGESLPVATGVALHLSAIAEEDPARRPLSCAYIGDGTWGEGAVYEALNIAARWRLPLLVVVENNAIAQSTPTAYAMAGTIGGRAAAFGITHRLLTSVDINELRREIAPVIAGVRSGQGPAILEFTAPRLGPHSKGDDSRSEPELTALRERDWAHVYRARHGEQFDAIDARTRAEIAEIVRDVLARESSEVRDV
jgi:TPP-dependent pyruvate/acetoin dehydrogenase alpha subunit